MRRIILLSLALVCPALAERAVYTGSVKVQNLANPSASSVVRIAEVIDLESGKIVTVALTGTKLNFTFNVGTETECVIAKAADAKGHSTTAFAQAAAATDQSGSKFALSTVLRGADATVTLSDAGTSHWPRTLIGSGSLVAAAGANTVATPGGISLSIISVTLSVPYSQLANSSGGTLEQCAEVVGQAYRDAVAKSLKYPTSNGMATTSSGATIGSGVVVAATGANIIPGGTLSTAGANLLITSNMGGFDFSKTGAGSAPLSNANPYNGYVGGATLELYPSGGSLGVSGSSTVKTLSGVGVALTLIDSGAISVAQPILNPPLLNGTASGAATFTGFTAVTASGSSNVTTIGSGSLSLSSPIHLTTANFGNLTFASTYNSINLPGGVAITSLPVASALTSPTGYTGFPIGEGSTFLTNSGPALSSLLTANPNLAAFTLNGGTLTIVGASTALSQTGPGTLTLVRSTGSPSTISASSILAIVPDPAPLVDPAPVAVVE